MEERYSLNDVLNVVEARYPRVELPRWNLWRISSFTVSHENTYSRASCPAAIRSQSS